MLRGTLPGTAGSVKASMLIGTPLEKSNWLTPLEKADSRRANSYRVALGKRSSKSVSPWSPATTVHGGN